MQKMEVGTASSCFYRLVEEVVYQPVPLEIPQERSITSCALTCMHHPTCFFMAISGNTCIMTEDVGKSEYHQTQQGDQKCRIYKKVKLLDKASPKE